MFEQGLRDQLRVVGGKGQRAHPDQSAAIVVVDLDHAVPVFDQILDRAIGVEGKDRIALGLGPERAQIDGAVDVLDQLLALQELIQDVGVR